jgi:hypothetical protein
MNHDQFVYWLQGFVEMNGGKQPTKEQWKMITDHLKLCFNKVTPPYQIRPLSEEMTPYHTNPLQPPFKVTCTTAAVGGSFGGDLKLVSGSYGEVKRNGGGGAC